MVIATIPDLIKEVAIMMAESDNLAATTMQGLIRVAEDAEAEEEDAINLMLDFLYLYMI